MNNYLLFILLGFLFVFSGCKEDDVQHPEHEHEKIESRRISFREFLEKEGNDPQVQKIRKYFRGAHLEILSKEGKDSMNWEIDTVGVTQIITPELTTYTFRVIEHDTISGFRNVIVKDYNNEIKTYLAHYPDGVDFENQTDANVIVEQLEGPLFRAAECFVLRYQCLQCGMTMCNVEPGWVLIRSTCSDSGGGGGGYNPDPDPYDPDIPTDPGNQPIGGDPDGGGGNGNGNGNVTPCQALNQKLTDANFKNKINELKGKVYSSNFEHGFVNHNPRENPDMNSDQMNQYTATTSNMTEHTNSPAFVHEQSKIGLMHSHPDGPNLMTIHSPADIKKLAVIWRYRYGMSYPGGQQYSLHETYSIVVGKHGVYALKVENMDNFINSYIFCDRGEFLKFWLDFEEKYHKIMPIGIENNTKQNNEKTVLKMLTDNYETLGFAIYRANDNLTGWSRLALNENGIPIEIPCN